MNSSAYGQNATKAALELKTSMLVQQSTYKMQSYAHENTNKEFYLLNFIILNSQELKL